MNQIRYARLLQGLGLSAQEGFLYEVLLQAGAVKASVLAKRTGLTRTNTYNIVNSLVSRGLVSIDRNGKQLIYSPVHPAQLGTLLDERSSALSDTKKQFDTLRKDMIADFMIGAQRPSVVMFEGRAGIIRAYDDLLLDKLPLQSIQDMNKLDRYLGDYNPRFIQERVKRRIRHRLIGPESMKDFATKDTAPYREVRYLPESVFAWDIDLKITEKKLVLTTFMSETIAGVVVINPDITKSMHSLFETLWTFAKI